MCDLAPTINSLSPSSLHTLFPPFRTSCNVDTHSFKIGYDSLFYTLTYFSSRPELRTLRLTTTALLFLPVLGVVITLALWGSLGPVQTGLHPADSVLTRITGSVQSSFLLSGAYQLFAVSPKVNGPSDEGVGGCTGPSDLMVLPTMLDSEFLAVPDIPAADPMPDPSETVSVSQPTSTGMDFDYVDASSAPRASRNFVLVVAAVVYLGYWLTLVIFENLTPSDAVAILTCLAWRPTPQLKRPTEGSVTVTIDSRATVVLPDNRSICDIVLASLDSEDGSTSESCPPTRDLVLYFDLAARFSKVRRPATPSQWSEGTAVVHFHPIVDKAIYRLAIKVCMVQTEFPPAQEPDPASEFPRSNRHEALVLRRLENVSAHVFLDMVGFLLAKWDYLQTFQVNVVVPQAEVGSLAPSKKRRMGTRQRRRIGKGKLVRQQAEVLSDLAPPPV